MKFSDLIEKSGDSQLVGVFFDGHRLSLECLAPDIEGRISITACTNWMFSTYDPRGMSGTFFLRCLSLREHLSMHSGVYIPSSEFPAFMDEARAALNLAYGLRGSQFGFLVSLTGDFQLSFLVASLTDIDVRVTQRA